MENSLIREETDMKGMGDIKRRMRSEIACMNKTLVIILAAACVLLGILFAISGVDKYVYWYCFQPKCAMAPFFMVLFWIIAYAVFGASVAIALAAPCYRSQTAKKRAAILAACTLVLCYVWIPVVYKAASFFLATLLVAGIVICLAGLFSLFTRLSKLASWGILLFAAWMLYILYYSFTLFLLN